MKSRNTSKFEEEQMAKVVANNINVDKEKIKNLRNVIGTFVEQADAQFKCGDRHATFSKEFIRVVKNQLKGI